MLPTAAIDSSTATLRSLAILLADDDAAARSAVRGWLEEHGHTVVCVGSGNEAARMVRQQPFDVVITEIVMPNGDGLELILEIKKRQPQARIIALSGGGRYLPAADCLYVAKGLGAHEVLMKPAQCAAVLAAVGHAVGV